MSEWASAIINCLSAWFLMSSCVHGPSNHNFGGQVKIEIKLQLNPPSSFKSKSQFMPRVKYPSINTCQDSSVGKAWNCNRKANKVLGSQVQSLLEVICLLNFFCFNTILAGLLHLPEWCILGKPQRYTEAHAILDQNFSWKHEANFHGSHVRIHKINCISFNTFLKISNEISLIKSHRGWILIY